ncbi:MAG: ABC transporter ATP-binding protein [Anaerolineae bacterium]
MSQVEVTNLSKHFGGIQAVHEVTLAVEAGERHAIIGPNGAGKSTLFNLIAGELMPTKGQVFLDGQDVTHLPVYDRANLGLGHTFQRNNLFMGLTVFENVRLAVQHRHRVNRHWLKAITSFTEVCETAEAILERVGLLPQKDGLVSALAYGQQRALEIALALATEPKVLLLDEPTAGMSPAETAEMTRLIQELPRSLTMMIVEHDMDVIFSLTDRMTVLHYGQVISQGAPEEVRADPMVQEIYLGAASRNANGQ